MRLACLNLVLSLALAGCLSQSGVDALDVTANDITGSINRPAADVSGGGNSAPAPTALTALTEDEESGEAVERVAMMVPPNPTSRPARKAGRSAHPPRFRDAKPVSFGPVTPNHYPVHGVDVSRWQGEIDWKTLHGQGARFAFIKATDGGDHLDPMFTRNWKEAEKAGVRRGAYHFFYWCRTAASQAEWFIRNVPKEKGALPPVLDVEWNHLSACRKRPSRTAVIEKMQVFVDRLERHYGQRPIIYTTPDFYRDNLQGSFPNHPFWLRSVAAHPSKVYPGREWLFWQYSGTGLSQGVQGQIDLNVFAGDEKAWQRWLAKIDGQI
jgi:lysozyme